MGRRSVTTAMRWWKKTYSIKHKDWDELTLRVGDALSGIEVEKVVFVAQRQFVTYVLDFIAESKCFDKPLVLFVKCDGYNEFHVHPENLHNGFLRGALRLEQSCEHLFIADVIHLAFGLLVEFYFFRRLMLILD